MIFLQTLTEKTKELEKLRSEWTCQSSDLSSRHFQELQSERDKALEAGGAPSHPGGVELPLTLWFAGAEQAAAADGAAAPRPGERPQEEQPAAAEQAAGAGDVLQGADGEEVQERVGRQRPED